MTRRKRTPPPVRSPYAWITVRASLHCWLGNHEVGAGVQMRFRKDDPFRRGSCATCLAAHGAPKPARSFTFTGEVEDVRARQVGGDD